MTRKRRLLKLTVLVLILAISGLIIKNIFSWWSSQKLDSSPDITVYITAQKQAITLPLEHYITGVVLAEMPASFEFEALKSQAVCARTYSLYKVYSSASHPRGAQVCDDVNHCQAYIDPATLPPNSPKLKRIREAVAATCGQVLTYQGNLINALYHSTCGGRTASAQEVWGRASPYLLSTDCPCSNNSPHRLTQHCYTLKEMRQAFAIKAVNPGLKITAYTPSGRAAAIKVGERVVPAAQFRRQLQLPSTALQITRDQELITISCRGYGHGVGLCQYGASAMAARGEDYRSILEHYYQGTELCRLEY